MRILFTITFILNSLIALTQENNPLEIVKVVESPYRPPTVTIYKDDQQIDSLTARFNGEMIYKLSEIGTYRLVFNASGQESKSINGIFVEKNQVLNLTIKIKGYCIYDYPSNYTPICPKQHGDKILPIKYGLIGRRVLHGQELKEPDYYSGGCVTIGCDPKFYCAIHKLEF